MITDKLKSHFLSLAGINRIICILPGEEDIRVTALHRKRHFEIDEMKTIPVGTDIGEIRHVIEAMVDAGRYRNTGIVTMIHNYMVYTAAVPVEESNAEEWVRDNMPDIFPDRSLQDDYHCAFEIYARDEENIHYYIVLTRRKEIEYIESFLAGIECPYSVILPLELTILTKYSLDMDGTILFVNMDGQIVRYAFMHDTRKVTKGELFIAAEDMKDSHESFNGILGDIKSHIETEFGNLQTPPSIIINKESNSSTDTPGSPTEFSAIMLDTGGVMSSVAGFVFKNPHRVVDLQTNRNIVQKKVEERIVHRGVFYSALIMLIMLASTGIIEKYYIHHLETNRQDLVEINSMRELIASVEEENRVLTRNLSAVEDVKYRHMPVSFVLHKIPEYLPPTAWSTGMVIDRSEGGGFVIEINGVASGQGDIAEIMQRMESDSSILSTSLIFANAIPQRELSRTYNINRSSYIRYHITSKYHAH
jgi:hypothetical protein